MRGDNTEQSTKVVALVSLHLHVDLKHVRLVQKEQQIIFSYIWIIHIIYDLYL